MADAVVSQIGAEFVSDTLPSAVVSQIGTEFVADVNLLATVNQIGAEFVSDTHPTMRVSQIGVEMLLTTSAVVSQMGVEMVLSNAIPGDTTPYIESTTYRMLTDTDGRILLERENIGEYDVLYVPSDDPSHDEYLAARADWFCQYGDYLYVSGCGKRCEDVTGTVYKYAPMVIDPSIMRVVATTDASNVVAIRGISPEYFGSIILRGDRITITDSVTGAAETRTIIDYSAPSTLYVDSAFDNTYSSQAGIIARLNYLGIDAPEDAIADERISNKQYLGAGIYLYKYVLKNKLRGVKSAGNPEHAVAVTDGVAYDVRLSGWGGEPIDQYLSKWGGYQCDRIIIYRTIANGDTFYPLTTLFRNKGTTANPYQFQTAYYDHVPDSALNGEGARDCIGAYTLTPTDITALIDATHGDGKFADDPITDWTAGTGWTISSGAALHAAGTASDLTHTNITVGVRGYEIRIKTHDVTSGQISFSLGTVSSYKWYSASDIIDNEIVETLLSTSSGSTEFKISASADFVGVIDSVSVLEAAPVVGQPGTPRIVSVSFKAATDTQSYNPVTYTVTGLDEGGSRITDTISFGAAGSVTTTTAATATSRLKFCWIESVVPGGVVATTTPSEVNHAVGVEAASASGASTTAGNMIRNYSFESGAYDGNESGVDNWEFTGGASTKINGTNDGMLARTGSYALELDRNIEAAIQRDIAVTAGTVYTITAHCATRANAKFYVAIDEFDVSNAQVGSTTYLPSASPGQSVAISDTAYQEFKYSYTAAATVTHVDLHIASLTTQSGTFWFDDIYMYPATLAESTDIDEQDIEYTPDEVYDSAYNQSAPPLTSLISYNERLWGVSELEPQYLAMSTLGQPEYWPSYRFGSSDTAGLTGSGGLFQAGTAGNRVICAVPEIGAYQTVGRAGSSLLVFAERHANRIFGYDTSDFKMDVAFPVGCSNAAKTVQNCGGVIVWASDNGIMAAPAGGSNPNLISEPIRAMLAPYVPGIITASGGHYTNSSGTNQFASAVSAYWQGYYFLSWGDTAKGETSNYNCVVCNLKTGSWFLCDYIQATGFHVSSGQVPGATSGSLGDLLWCNSQVATSGQYPLYRMRRIIHADVASDFTIDGVCGVGTAGVPFNITYNVLPMSSNSETWLQRKMLKRVVVLLGAGDEDFDLTLGVWPFGDSMALYPETPECHDSDTPTFTQTKAVSASAGHIEYRLITFYPQILCRWPMLALSGTATSDVRIKGMQIEWENQAQDDLPSDYE